MCLTAPWHRRSVAGSPPSQVHAPPPRAHDARGVRTRGFLSGWRPRGACSWRGTTRPCFHLGDHHHLGTTAQNKATGLGICCACGAELLALGHSGVASFCCPCFFFGRGLQTAPFACLSSGVRDSWTARFSRYLAALPPLGAWNSTSQLWVYQLVAIFVRHSTE